MSILKKLFGGAQSEPEAESYEGFTIRPTPIAEGGQYRLCAVIEKEVDGVLKSYRLIRADMLPAQEEAAKVSVAKARQVIDEMGERLFD